MKNKKIIVASGNKDKIQEIKYVLKGLQFDIVSKDDMGLDNIEVIEDKETLAENAIKKAVEISKHVDGIVIADDTGLFVDALDGRPGVYSARYAGENVTYKDNNDKLLKELKDISLDKRTAAFKTVIAIVFEDKSVKIVEGQCEGYIGFEPKGSQGFGYDPLFIVEGYEKTFAELGEDIKNRISHRARALKALKEELQRMIKGEDTSI